MLNSLTFNVISDQGHLDMGYQVLSNWASYFKLVKLSHITVVVRECIYNVVRFELDIKLKSNYQF
jgi:hypothetical protein